MSRPAAPEHKRLHPDVRRADILEAAMRAARDRGYDRISRAEVATSAGISEALVSHYFGTMNQLRKALMRHAVITEDLRIVAQGLVAGDRHAQRAPDDLKQRAAASLA